MTEEQKVPEHSANEAEAEDQPGSEAEEKATIIFPTPEEIAELAGGEEEASAEASPADGTAEIDLAALQEKAGQAEEYFRRLQRLQAEFDNYRKRITRERGELKQWAIRSLVEELVDVIDAFERALHEEHSAEVPAPYRKGIEMVQRKLRETLARYGLTRLEVAGETFDPHFHEALAHEPNEEHASGVIIDEVKPGYLLGERLLRPSLVRVSAGPGPSGDGGDGESEEDPDNGE